MLNQMNPTNNAPIESRIHPSQQHQHPGIGKLNLLRDNDQMTPKMKTNGDEQRKRNILRATERTTYKKLTLHTTMQDTRIKTTHTINNKTKTCLNIARISGS